MEQTIREVEVSVWETSNAVFYYMTDPSEISLQEYKKQQKDVDKFYKKYIALIDTDHEKKMAAKFSKMWAGTLLKAEELIKLRNSIAELNKNRWDKHQQ